MAYMLQNRSPRRFLRFYRAEDNIHNRVQGPGWRPTSLRTWFLVLVLLVSGGLIVAVVVLLRTSQANNGLMFAPDINALPTSKTFQYLNLPTILAVLYGLIWAWIDLDVRRMEPFYQLSKRNGAMGHETMLLHYPVDFVAAVPFKAVKLRHWTVFAASLATVSVFWGVTPIQAGIFAVETVNKTQSLPLLRSESYASLSSQIISAESASSVANIVWLNETMPSFMSRNAVIAPFGPATMPPKSDRKQTYTGKTMLYSVNLTCEASVSSLEKDGVMEEHSSWGCRLPPVSSTPLPSTPIDPSKIYSVAYVGYYDPDGTAPYYLYGNCPKNETQSIYVQWSRVKEDLQTFVTLPPDEQVLQTDSTKVWCRSSYYGQEVLATVLLPRMEIMNYTALSAPASVPSSIFNVSQFETAMNTGYDLSTNRTAFPTTHWPDQSTYISDMPISSQLLSPVDAIAIGATKRAAEDYLDQTVLSESYEAAYRLFFARHMSNILSKQLTKTTETLTYNYETEAILVVPAFAIIVIAILACVCALIVVILLGSAKKCNLRDEPADIASLMSLVTDSTTLLDSFRNSDRASNAQLEKYVGDQRFEMKEDSSIVIPAAINTDSNNTSAINAAATDPSVKLLTGVRPTELKLWVGGPFLFLELSLFIALSALYLKARQINGLPLPSTARFTRQLVENYLPTALGTFIEPLWAVLNRHLCLLRPFDRLRVGRQEAHASIGLNYASLPPQFFILKALKNRDILLAFVCAVALLSNVLSIALSGLFFEKTVTVTKRSAFVRPMSLPLQPLNGSDVPFTRKDQFFRSGELHPATLQPFYALQSNYSAQTPMPPWTDAENFYLPFQASRLNSSLTYQGRTLSLAATYQCDPAQVENFDINGHNNDTARPRVDMSFFVTGQKGKVRCGLREAYASGIFNILVTPHETSAFEMNCSLDGLANSSKADADTCRSHVMAGWVRAKLKTEPEASFSVINATVNLITCKPTLILRDANVITAHDGHILKVISSQPSNVSTSALSDNLSDLFGQANQFIVDKGMTWHNDSFPSDYNNYLLAQRMNDSSFLDPTSQEFINDSHIRAMEKIYQSTFAILLSQYRERLFRTQDDEQARKLGPLSTTEFDSILQPETRIFLSATMFAIAQSILLLNIFVTIALYAKRPWKMLVRMPTSIASVIAFFAASCAVEDMKHTLPLTKKEREKLLRDRDNRYGFGTFHDAYGDAHVGIEKYPFVAPLTKTKPGLSWRRRSNQSTMTEQSRWKVLEYEKSKVKEGGMM